MASLTAADWRPEGKPRLKLAFCLYKYFPHGGLQRDFLRIGLECQRRGHQVKVYTLSWRGEVPEGFDVRIVPVAALTNHTLYERFSRYMKAALEKDPVDCVIGINKMPDLDVYYAADSCYEEKAQSQRSWLYRLLPRYRHFSRFEKAVFGGSSRTEILMISQMQKQFFDRHYRTRDERIRFLPPGISKDRIAPPDIMARRRAMRRKLGLQDDERLLLMVGSGFVKKGLKRALYALRSLPRGERKKTRFLVIGEDNPAPFLRLAAVLGVRKRLTILSGRDDVPDFLFAADLLILPALDEAAGIVILEAIVAGLPVLATDNCGYARYIVESGMGQVVASPFRQKELNEKLRRMLRGGDRQASLERSREFAETADIYSLHGEAADFIEKVALQSALRKSAEASESKGTVAFCLFKYFPYGGLQRDFLRIAEKTRQRGCRIRVYALSWQGDLPEGFELVIAPVNAVTNHSRYRRFHEWVARHLEAHPVDCVVGFNKMPGLDIYYAADSCYEHKARTQRSRLYRSTPRYRMFSDFEAVVFGETSNTEILMISPTQGPLFERYYRTPASRVRLLPPGIERSRIAPPDRDEIRQSFREEMALGEGDNLLLLVGSGFVTKGLDRILIALSSLGDELVRKTRLVAIGQDAPGAFRRMASRLGLADRVEIMKGRDDIPRFLMGADLLVHPAYLENAGIVLLEAIVAGLPVLATDVCGYAHHVEDAGAGKLIPSPFKQETMNGMLKTMLNSPERGQWSRNGMAYARCADIFSMPDQAADLIVARVVARAAQGAG